MVFLVLFREPFESVERARNEQLTNATEADEHHEQKAEGTILHVLGH
jgi:hypothetical protein